MKKLVLIGAIAAISGMSYGQKAKVVSAYNYLKKGQLDKAKSYIDEAAEDPSTGIDAKTWKYRFDVYLAIANSQDIEVKALVNAEDLLPTLQESYNNIKKYDEKDKYLSDLNKQVKMLSNASLNQGVEAFNEKNYLMATAGFAGAAQIGEMIGYTDSLAYFNTAVAAEQAANVDSLPADAKTKLKEAALESYKKCIEIKYNIAQAYNRVITILQDDKKMDEAFNIIKQGRVDLPNDQGMIIAELNYYLSNKQFDKALANLELAVKNDPNNANLYYAIGTTFDNLANPSNADGTDAPKPDNYNELIVKAKYNYEKAIEIKPDYFDAQYNLGALIYNDGVYDNNKANELDFRKEKAKIEELTKRSEEKFKASLPILEKAFELNKEDASTKASLLQLYVRLGMNDKYKALKGN